MSELTTVYCDESGNDGPNYLNPQQPFYVLAGWAVPDNRRDDAVAAIQRLHRSVCRDSIELKFKTFKKSEGKRESLIQLVCELGQIGLVPVFLFAEKRFCVAGKIVETFLDPYYNPLVRNGLTWDAQTKQELANTFYEELPATTLEAFARAYQNPTEMGLKEALDEVVRESHGRVSPELAAFSDGSRAELAAIAADEAVAANSFEKAGGTLNFPCLVTYMMLVEHLARQKVINPHRLVHDEQGPYQAGYQEVFRIHRHAADHWVTLAGQEVPYGALRAIQSFEIQRSVDQPLIQAADLLAGSVNYICTKLQAGQPLTATEKELATFTLPLMLVPDLQLAWPICSDRMLKHIGRLFNELYGSGGGSGSARKRDSDSPLPVFPVAKPTLKADKTFPVTLPIFAATRASDGAVLIELPPGLEARECDRGDRCVPLFTDEAIGKTYLEGKQAASSVSLALRRFDVHEVVDLLEQLEARAEHASYVAFNVTPKGAACIELNEFIGNMRRIGDRIVRAIRSGASETLLQHHVIDGREAMSLLLSGGEYAAAWKNDEARVVTGTTRDGALAALQA